jgi:hypothetical protein
MSEFMYSEILTIQVTDSTENRMVLPDFSVRSVYPVIIHPVV